MNATHLILIAVVAHGFYSEPANAQSSTDTNIIDSGQASRTAEVVLGEIETNELKLYELFNARNSSNEFDIVFSTRPDAPPNSSRQICEPMFLERIRQENEKEILQRKMQKRGFFSKIRSALTGPRKLKDQDLRALASDSIESVEQEMQSLAAQHPPLLAKLQVIGELQIEYAGLVETERQRYAYFMRNNGPLSTYSFNRDSRVASSKPWFSAPPPGHSRPEIHFDRRDQLHR